MHNSFFCAFDRAKQSLVGTMYFARKKPGVSSHKVSNRLEPVQVSYQLSYEATHVGSSSVLVGQYMSL